MDELTIKGWNNEWIKRGWINELKEDELTITRWINEWMNEWMNG